MQVTTLNGAQLRPNCFGSDSEGTIIYAQSHTWFMQSNIGKLQMQSMKHDINCLKFLSDYLIACGTANGQLALFEKDGNNWFLKGEYQLPSNGAVLDVTLLGTLHLVVASTDAQLLALALAIDKMQPSQTLKLPKGNVALCVTSYVLDDETAVVACGLSDASIHIYYSVDGGLVQGCIVGGHSDWVKSLAFTQHEGQVMLASASQDKYIRLWRIVRADSSVAVQHELATSAQTVVEGKWLVHLDAVLGGHEDWVNCVKWLTHIGDLQLISASADKSIMVWRRESDVDGQNVWNAYARLIDLGVAGQGISDSSYNSASGGVGSAGFYGLCTTRVDDGKLRVVGHSYQGTLQSWDLNDDGEWLAQPTQTGHFAAVKSVEWSANGLHLLSCALDKTARLWTQLGGEWRELCRPQIHGYPLLQARFIDAPGTQYISCAEGEKVLRVFSATPLCRELMQRSASDAVNTDQHTFWRGTDQFASLPALGLSNKAATATTVHENDANGKAAIVPRENHLSSVTLWHETDKLYAHGDDLQCLAVSHDFQVCVSANVSRASYIDIAQKEGTLRSWHITDGENGVKQVRKSQVWNVHTQTISSIAFSPDDTYFVTVGRDRRWTLFGRLTDTNYKVSREQQSAHARVIWDVKWAHDSKYFVTCSRDGNVKWWSPAEGELINAVKLQESATALACHPTKHRVAVGVESGQIEVFERVDGKWQLHMKLTDCPVKSVTSMDYRASGELAVASADATVRIYTP